jgi:hypothetical protein
MPTLAVTGRRSIAASASANHDRSKPIVISGQVEQLILCVPAAGQDRVHVDVVPYLCPSEQGADLVGHGIVRVQDRPDRQADWFVLPPVQAQLDLRALRSGPDTKACEGRIPDFGLDLKTFAQISLDDSIHRLSEVELTAGLGERADIGGRAVQLPGGPGWPTAP